MTLNRTIAAVSTARGKGGIAVIRISGSDTLSVVRGMFEPRSGRDIGDVRARTAIYGTIIDAEGNACDEGICVFYRSPASFTGEDMAEISCHGGLAVTEATLMSALSHGASMAEAGEFTRRAFISGKLSLTEAEAVGQLIEADTKERMLLSGGAVRGNVRRKIDSLYNGMLDTMTALYAAIDYPEEDVGDEGEREIFSVISRTRDEVGALLATYRTGRAVSDGVRCAICGCPNVGKSSIFNCIVGDESAIVTQIAGTTRDVLRETVSFGGITLRLSDTAGIRESDDVVEKMGIGKAEDEARSAELLLCVFDGSRSLTDDDRRILALARDAAGTVLGIVNKADLGVALSENELGEIRSACGEAVVVSAKEGIGEVAAAVSRLFGSDTLDLSHDAIIWDARHREMLLHAKSALDTAYDSLASGLPVDCVCTSVEEAMAALSETDGRGVEDTIITEIFSRFCVGK